MSLGSDLTPFFDSVNAWLDNLTREQWLVIAVVLLAICALVVLVDYRRYRSKSAEESAAQFNPVTLHEMEADDVLPDLSLLPLEQDAVSTTRAGDGIRQNAG